MIARLRGWFEKFNYRIKWFDGWENHKLLLDNYGGAPTSPYNSWVLLSKVRLVEGNENQQMGQWIKHDS